VRTETLPAETLLWRILLHALPREFNLVRDYGYLHRNTRQPLQFN
jgi:hypothetical protein